ncbi:kinase-like domain-containing protein [Crucibulum laeve]|uniref:Kinase-like domain-containing protein n=1 Tax=Crucibulum laeve TaxID=68775 RepID=A0A5C3MMA1_9AGAR|nr:kinase-like domain-containing protein [Crucibulum laeve]
MSQKFVATETNALQCSPAVAFTAAPDPRRIDPVDNPRLQEAGCIAITHEKKYYEFLEDDKNQVFMKRNLTPSEYLVNRAGNLVIPKLPRERMENEVAAIRYIQEHTTIPTPNIRCAFEDHGRYYIITDVVPGATLAQLSEEQKAVVIKELDEYVAQLHSITSSIMGGFSGRVCLPYRISEAIDHDDVLKFREAETPEFVLCHNDLSQHNVIVDEETLKVNAILDWEYAGFYPREFDSPFYYRPGPSAAIEDEKDDVPELLKVLDKWRVV